MNDETIATVMDRAADLLEKEGWCQGNAFDIKGRMCMLGALDKASVHSPFMYEELARKVASYLKFDGPDDIIAWNDDESRKAEDVVTVLRNVASNEKELMYV